MRFFIFILLLLLSGCGRKETPPPPSPSPSQLEEAPSPTPTSQEETPAPPIEQIIGSFSTPIRDTTPNRLHNISLATDAINGMQLASGETFSFNTVVGERTAEKGYREAIVFIEHEKKPGIGGGVCQISTTLYNAALSAGLEIVEHHTHSVEVDYIEKGKDATVNYPDLDLKIRNNSGKTLRIDLVLSDEDYTAAFTALP